MAGLGVAIVGAGSTELALDVVRAVLHRKELHGSEIRLMDIDPDRLSFALAYSQRLMAENGRVCSVTASQDRGVALEGAGFVIATVAIGGESMRRHDVQVPLKHGIVHVKGDTTGPAGIFRGLRSIPFVVGLARQMELLAPDAVLLNLSNPLTTMTRAVLRETPVRAVGICSCIDEMKLDFAAKMGVAPERLQVRSIGVNHLTWMTGISCDGRDAMEEFVAKVIPYFRAGLPVTAELYDAYGCFPIPGYKYASEFFPYFLGPTTHGGRDLGFEPYVPDGGTARAAGARSLLAREMEGDDKLPVRQPTPLAETVAAVMTSIACGQAAVHNINVPNLGRVPAVPPDAVLEGPVRVSGDGWRPLDCGKLPRRIERVLERVVREQELVVEAAVKGDRELLFEAFLMDGLVGSLSAARQIIDELLELEREYLPQFHRAGPGPRGG